MNKPTLILLLALLLALVINFAVVADDGFYASIGGGGSMVPNATNRTDEEAIIARFENGFYGSLAGGYDFGDFRTEIEIGYRQNELSGFSKSDFFGTELDTNVDRTARVLSYMFNGFYDVPTKTKLTPYIGGGIGIARVSWNDIQVGPVEVIDFERPDDKETEDEVHTFAYQFGAGLTYPINKRLDLSLDYRYFVAHEPKFEASGKGFDTEYQAHTVGLSLRLRF